MNGNEMSGMRASRRISLERTYKASIDDVWDLWTTKEGLESWWARMDSPPKSWSSICDRAALCIT